MHHPFGWEGTRSVGIAGPIFVKAQHLERPEVDDSLGQRFKMLGHGRVDAFAGSDEELDLAAWFSESCHSFSINRFFELQWQIFIKDSSILTQDSLRRRIQEFVDTYQSQHYDRIRKNVLGNRYCPRPAVN